MTHSAIETNINANKDALEAIIDQVQIVL